jgi:hypothetical protein
VLNAFFVFAVIHLCEIDRINLVTEKPSAESELSVMKVRFILEVGFSDSCFQGHSLSGVYLVTVKMRVAYFSMSYPSVLRQEAGERRIRPYDSVRRPCSCCRFLTPVLKFRKRFAENG